MWSKLKGPRKAKGAPNAQESVEDPLVMTNIQDITGKEAACREGASAPAQYYRAESTDPIAESTALPVVDSTATGAASMTGEETDSGARTAKLASATNKAEAAKKCPSLRPNNAVASDPRTDTLLVAGEEIWLRHGSQYGVGCCGTTQYLALVDTREDGVKCLVMCGPSSADEDDHGFQLKIISVSEARTTVCT